jgi:hypothetical protein
MTVTIALTPTGLLAGCADDPYPIEKAVRDVELEAGVEFTDLRIVEGLTLTDELQDGDEVVFESGKTGWLTNADESQFTYAVRRS